MKTKYDTLGYQYCPDYDPCPLCYGCRAFNPSRVKCQNLCEHDNPKFNICNKEKHTEKALSLMIRREHLGSFRSSNNNV